MYRAITIRRAPSQIRPYMRTYNELVTGSRHLKALIEQELSLQIQRKKNINNFGIKDFPPPDEDYFLEE